MTSVCCLLDDGSQVLELVHLGQFDSPVPYVQLLRFPGGRHYFCLLCADFQLELTGDSVHFVQKPLESYMVMLPSTRCRRRNKDC